MNDASNFYYQGKFFETEQEFWAYVNEFTYLQTTEEDFNSLFDMLKKDIWMNLCIRKTQMTNSELRNVLGKTFLCFLEEIWKKNDDE